MSDPNPTKVKGVNNILVYKEVSDARITFIIQNKTDTDQQTRVDVEDYNYENAADQEGYCPDVDDDQDAYDDNMETMTGTILDQEVPDITCTMSAELFTGENLVEAPKLVDKAALQIG